MQTILQEEILTIIKDSQRGKQKQFSSCCDSCHPIQRQGRFCIMTSSVDIFSAVKGGNNKQAVLREEYTKKTKAQTALKREQTQRKNRDKRSREGERIHSDSCLWWADFKGDIRSIACNFGLGLFLKGALIPFVFVIIFGNIFQDFPHSSWLR